MTAGDAGTSGFFADHRVDRASQLYRLRRSYGTVQINPPSPRGIVGTISTILAIGTHSCRINREQKLPKFTLSGFAVPRGCWTCRRNREKNSPRSRNRASRKQGRSKAEAGSSCRRFTRATNRSVCRRSDQGRSWRGQRPDQRAPQRAPRVGERAWQ